MNMELSILECAERISRVSKKISQAKLLINDYKEYYTEIINIYDELKSIFIDYFSKINNKDGDIEDTKIRAMRCECKALKLYNNFCNNIYNTSGYFSLVSFKHSFLKNNGYQDIIENIKTIKKELNTPNNFLTPLEILNRQRQLAQKYDELLSQKLITNPTIFWAILTAIITTIGVFISITKP